MAAASAAPPPNQGAISLRGWALEAEAAAVIARQVAGTSFVPDHLRVYENPKERDPAKRVEVLDGTVAQVTAVLLAGQELGLEPMASLRAFVIIKGQVALYAITCRALLLHAGHEIIVKESTSQRAIVVARRAGSEHWQTATWDVERARVAGLYPGHPDGNWRRQTKAMLVARATAEAARWVASDAMLALPLIAEEVEDAEFELPPPDVDVIVGDGQAAAPERKTTTRKRPSRARAALPAAPPPEAAAEPEHPPRRGPKPDKAQLGKLHDALTALQISGPEEGLGLVSVWAGRPVQNTGDLTADELAVVLERAEALLAAARAAGPAEGKQPEPAPDEETPDEPPPDADLEDSPP
jgi:hypothetical protein